VVLPSLDAGDARHFHTINRPHPSLSFAHVLEGLIALRKEFSGQYWLEVFLLADVNSRPQDVERTAGWVKRIQPDRVQLNTVTRPAATDLARAVPMAALATLAKLFDPPAEVVADPGDRPCHGTDQVSPDALLNLLRRRPSTLEQVAQGLRLNRLEALKLLETLQTGGRLTLSQHDGRAYYSAIEPAPPGKRE
jgi:wyosine [tRNA(Phe)-imidazoG37] synthetase (radical SAM superfamily)